MASLEKAMFFDPSKKKPVYVQFNPNSLEYSYAKSREEREEESKRDPRGRRHQQQSPLDTRRGTRLSMRLFFHTYTNESSYQDVREQIKPLQGFLCKTDRKGARNQKVVFAWGPLGFEGYLDSLSVTYQMFAPDGTPVQAEVSVSLEGDDTQVPEDVSRKKVAVSRDEKAKASFAWLFPQG